MSDILKLYHYHRWANEQVIQHLKTLPEASLQQKLDSVFPTVNAVLVHIYRADYIWLHVLYGETYEQIVSQFDQFEKLDGDFEAIEHRMAELDKEYSKFLKELENTEGPISISHPRMGTLRTTYADVIRHVVNHGTYHRGNISAMLHQMGYKSVPTDYIFSHTNHKKAKASRAFAFSLRIYHNPAQLEAPGVSFTGLPVLKDSVAAIPISKLIVASMSVTIGVSPFFTHSAKCSSSRR